MLVIRRARRAFTLVELLIVIVVFGMVMAALLKVVVGQQRFYRGASEMIETQNNVRDAVAVLRSDLRGLSAAQNDIVAMTATSIDFWEPIGASVVCQIGAGATTVVIPPVKLAANNGLTSWVRPPARNDRVLFYDLGPGRATSDDAWRQYQLDAAPTSGATCPTVTGFTTTAAEAATGYTLTLSTALTQPNIEQGSSIRFLRQARYSLYQANDGRWYLGYQECPGGTCNTIQPVSGPYLPPSTSGPSGLTFTYFDSTGTVTATPTRVARIDVVTRSETRSDLQIPGFGTGPHVDSLSTSIALRN